MKPFLLIYIALTFIAFSISSFAQMPSGMGGGKIPSIAKVYGKIIDSKTKKPVEFASVALFMISKDSAVGGVLTKENGDFMLDNLPMGGFKFRVQFLGYKTIEKKMFINFSKLEQDLGDLALEPDETLLQEATVTADKGQVSLSIDKRVYNVANDLSVRGGTALDAMKNVPGVNVDADGNATMRNASPQIYIDGRPTQLTLQQIPADMIDRIEVITNPSVKFEAASSGGILNIVMKKNSKPGYNGVIMGGIGNTDRYNGMANLNIKEKAWNFSLMYNYMTQTNLTKGYTDRANLNSTHNVVNYYNQENESRNQMLHQMGRLGIDYQINNRNSISFAQMAMMGKFRTIDDQLYEILDGGNQLMMNGSQNNFSNAGFSNYNSQIIYKRTYPKPGKEFSMDLSGNFTNSKNTYRYDFHDYVNNVPVSPEFPIYQTNDANSLANMFTFQMDYTNPINDSVKIEWGVRSNFKQSDQSNTTQNSLFGVAVRDSFLSNNYHIDDIVNGAYVNYTNRIGKFSYQAGLRFEQSYYAGKILDKNESFSYSYPSKADNILKSIFPGIYLSRKFKNNQEWQINFSRKIERPNFFQLMPFVMFADKQNYRIGNPQLTPEFRNIAETNYNKIFDKGNYLTSIYFKYIESPITNVIYPKENDSLVLINTFANGASSFNYGWEHNLKFTIIKNLDLTANVNVLYISLKSTSQFGSTTTEGITWNTKATFSYKLPKDFTLQLNGNYEAPRVVVNGNTKPMYFVDLSANKMIKRKIILTASVSDVFNTKRMGTIYHTDFYDQSLMRRREARFFKFTAMFMFGKMDSSIFKKRKGGNMGGGGNQDGLDF